MINIFKTIFIYISIIKIIVKILNAPQKIIILGIVVLCVTGSFAIRNLISDVFVMLFFGFIGLIFFKLNLPHAPLAFGLILGPVLEENLRRSLNISRGSWSIFIERPVSLILILFILLVLMWPIIINYVKLAIYKRK